MCHNVHPHFWAYLIITFWIGYIFAAILANIESKDWKRP